ncbi:MAG TPA: lytic transglycosylase domain-containing protein [Burkholderiaceae bacterium]|nr:lytic transglycosylase domain-containing protein [Burkholderiaceae bacterium]
MVRIALGATLLVVSFTASPACFSEAAARYGVSPQLLCAVARCESDMRPDAVNRSHVARTGTVDYGLMQINSGHLPWLKQYGITEQHLLDACTNVQVGAYILAEKMQRYGNSWEAVGAYNAACTQLKGEKCTEARMKYAWCVHRRLAQCADPASQKARPPTGQSSAAAFSSVTRSVAATTAAVVQ